MQNCHLMNLFRIHNILVPVDLSESSLNALDAAVVIAKKHNASIQVLHVEENNFNDLEDISFTGYSSVNNAIDIINALTGAIQHTHGIKPLLLQKEGNVSDNIIRASFLYHADLIVMGAYGASGFREGFVGNNTYNVIKYAACPVLSVPYKKKITDFDKILFPVRPVTGALMSYSIVSHFTKPKTVMEVFGLSYRLMETGTSVLDTLVNEIKGQLEKDKVIPKVSWSEGSTIADEILRYANSTNPDLIVVTSALDVTSKPKYIGPHAQKIIHCSRVPLLSIKKIGIPSFA
jgi:nucleotide-binding universal stress UspA family protein